MCNSPVIEAIVNFNEWIPLYHKRIIQPIFRNDIVFENKFYVDRMIYQVLHAKSSEGFYESLALFCLKERRLWFQTGKVRRR